MSSPSDDKFQIRNGDRVVFWGDSITDNSFYTRTIENYVRSRYPHWKVDFFNFGWGGDTAEVGVKRMERDIRTVRPTLMTIKLGMNDGAYQAFDPAICNRYISNMERLIQIARKVSNPRLVFITTVQYETGVHPDEVGKVFDRVYTDTLRKFSDALIEMATRHKVPVIDLNRLYEDSIVAYKKDHPGFHFSTDGIHPLADGNALMAYHILSALGAEGDIMDISADLNNTTVAGSNCKLTAIKRESDGISFSRTVESFPFITSGEEICTADLTAWQSRLNMNRLVVTGIKKPYCIVEVNGSPIDVFKKETLEAGINLHHKGMPEEEVTAFIAELVREKHDARYRRWRNVLMKNLERTMAYLPETHLAKYLSSKARTIVKFLDTHPFRGLTYTIRLRESDIANPYPDSPFILKTPFPTIDQVQIKFQVDTSLWRNIRSERFDGPLSLTGPLKIKGNFTQWTAETMRHEGNGVFTFQANTAKGLTNEIFAFDDESQVRSSNESLFMEIIKTGIGAVHAGGSFNHPSFVPDKNKIVEVTKEDFLKAVEMKKIIVQA